MTRRYERKLALLAKNEATYATDATPTGAANAMQVTDVTITPLEAQELDRNLYQSYLGNQGKILSAEHVSINYKVEMAGSGAAGTAPAWGPLLRACGFAETVNAGTSVEYLPVSAAYEAATQYCNLDGVNHALLGSRGSVKFTMNAQQIPYLEFTFKGLFVAVADMALPAQTLTAFQKPVKVSNDNTGTFSIHGFDAIGESFELDMANDLQGRFLIGSDSIEIVDRVPAGKAVVEAGLIAEKDWFGIAQNRTRGAIAIEHGTEAGNIIQIDCPGVEIGAPTYGVTNKIRNLSLPFMPIPDTGNDEVKITVL